MRIPYGQLLVKNIKIGGNKQTGYYLKHQVTYSRFKYILLSPLNSSYLVDRYPKHVSPICMTLGLKNKLLLKHGLDLQKQSSECIDYDILSLNINHWSKCTLF